MARDDLAFAMLGSNSSKQEETTSNRKSSKSPKIESPSYPKKVAAISSKHAKNSSNDSKIIRLQ